MIPKEFISFILKYKIIVILALVSLFITTCHCVKPMNLFNNDDDKDK